MPMDADAPVDDVDSRFAVRGVPPPAHNAPRILDSLRLPTAPISTTAWCHIVIFMVLPLVSGVALV